MQWIIPAEKLIEEALDHIVIKILLALAVEIKEVVHHRHRIFTIARGQSGTELSWPPLSSSASSSEEEDLVENDDAVEEQKNDEGDSNGTKGACKPEDINLDNVGDEKPLSKSQEESFALIQDFYDKRIKSDD